MRRKALIESAVFDLVIIQTGGAVEGPPEQTNSSYLSLEVIEERVHL